MFELSFIKYFASATSTFDASEATSILTGAIGTITSVLLSVLPVIVGLLAALMGLWFLWRIIQKKIGGTKG